MMSAIIFSCPNLCGSTRIPFVIKGFLLFNNEYLKLIFCSYMLGYSRGFLSRKQHVSVFAFIEEMLLR